MALHEIAGPILASAAVVLAIFVFKRTLDYQSYTDIDSNYMEILKIGVENPHLRDPQWIKAYYKEGRIRKTTDDKEKQKQLQYEQYAYLVWNICETLYDRKKVDETWAPVIQAEKDLHFEWIRQPENKAKFKEPFRRYVDNFHYGPNDPPSTRKASTRKASPKPYIIAGAIIVILVIAYVNVPALFGNVAYLNLPALFGNVEYFDSHVELECAHDIKSFNVSHAYDCSKFTAGSIAQLCVDDYKAFNLTKISGCSKFLVPGKTSS